MEYERNFVCPLVNREMWDAECYEVQLVRARFIKEDVMDFKLDRDEADEMCERCVFNQLRRGTPLDRAMA